MSEEQNERVDPGGICVDHVQAPCGGMRLTETVDWFQPLVATCGRYAADTKGATLNGTVAAGIAVNANCHRSVSITAELVVFS